jgi:acyl carrier protein phosphodiesterase
MNYLGHLYLSGTDPLVTVGNFMADAVKGRDLSRFDPRLEQGIRLHRAIDMFTDGSPVQSLGRARVHAHAGRYSSVVMDMFYDHLLASNWHLLHNEPLPEFAARMYDLLQAHEHLMPERARRMLPYMVAGDWLSTYATLEGVGRAIAGLARRVPRGTVMIGAERVLEEHLGTYTAEFKLFLPTIETAVAHLR